MNQYVYCCSNPDFWEIGYADNYEQIISDMHTRCDAIYGHPEIAARYAGGIIFHINEGISRKEITEHFGRWDEISDKIEHFVRFEIEWKLVDKEIFEKYADKFIESKK